MLKARTGSPCSNLLPRRATRRRSTCTELRMKVFHVLEGEFRFKVGEQEFRVGGGETLLAKGEPHTCLVESGQGR